MTIQLVSHLAWFIQAALLLAFTLNVLKAEWTLKRLLIANLVILVPNFVMIAFLNITMLVLYVWVLLIVLACRLVLKQPWRKSIFAGVFANFVGVVIEYVFLIPLLLLPEGTLTFMLNNLFIPRSITTISFVLLYIFSKRFKHSESSPLEYFTSTHWILYFLIFAFVADFNLSRFFDVKPSIHNAPEIIVMVLFLVFFLGNLLHLKNLTESITEKLVVEQMFENSQLELELQQTFTDSLSGFRHDFGNILNSMRSISESGDAEKLHAYIEEMTKTVHSSQAVQLASFFKPLPALHGVILDKVHRSELMRIRFCPTVTGGELDLKYFSDFEYSRIVGILLDNALEAADKSELRTMEFMMRISESNVLTIVQNSCSKEVDVERIFERGYSTKLKSSGEGLYQVTLLIEKYRELGYDTDITPTYHDGFFTQTLRI